MTYFRVSELACDIGDQRLLSDISFEFGQGESLAIVGVNGVGKSTLLRTLAGIAVPAAGSVHVNGCDIAQLSSRNRAKHIAYVGQEEGLAGDLTVLEAVGIGRLPYLKPWQLGSKAAEQKVLVALGEVGIADLAGRTCDELSGGQRRLVLLARALVQESEIFMLDEPTNHLDVRHQLELLRIVKSLGKTTLVTMHDLDLAFTHFDHVAIIHAGGLFCFGSAAQVLIPANIQQAFGVNAQVVNSAQCKKPHIIIESVP